MKDLERRLASLTRVAPQRWILGLSSVIAALVATLVAGSSGGGQSLLVSSVVVAFAVGSAIRPSTHTAIGVVAVVTWQWLSTNDDALSPLAVVVASALFAFHALIALMAVLPTTAAIDRAAARRWAQRSALVVGATLAMWGAVLLMDQRQAPGSVPLTFVGFLTVAVLVTALRLHRTPSRRQV
jgi:hypothetical protein